MTINIYDKDRMLLTGVLILALLGAIASMAVFFSGKPSILVSNSPDAQINLMSVSGTASDEFTPDKVELSFSVVTRGKDPKAIQQENDLNYKAAVKSVVSLGIPSENVKTTSYSLNKWSEWNANESKYVDMGYELRNTIRVVSYDVKLAGPILGAVVSAGVNEIGEVSFSLSDKAFQESYNMLLKKATVAAKFKANEMASAAGVSILKLSRLDEGYTYTPTYARDLSYKSLESASAPASVEVSPGLVKITVNVNAAYQLN